MLSKWIQSILTYSTTNERCITACPSIKELHTLSPEWINGLPICVHIMFRLQWKLFRATTPHCSLEEKGKTVWKLKASEWSLLVCHYQQVVTLIIILLSFLTTCQCYSDLVLRLSWGPSLTRIQSTSQQRSKRSASLYHWLGNLDTYEGPTADECLFSVSKLAQIHRNLGHAPAGSVYSALRRSQLIETGCSDLEKLINIGKQCKGCQLFAKQPNRYRAVLPDQCVFNYDVALDSHVHSWQCYSACCVRTDSFLTRSTTTQARFLYYVVFFHDNMDCTLSWCTIQLVGGSSKSISVDSIQDTCSVTRLQPNPYCCRSALVFNCWTLPWPATQNR